MIIHITEKHNGRTILDYARYELGLSRRILIRLKQTSGGIKLNGNHATVRAVLSIGDVLELSLEDDNFNLKRKITPYERDIEIIYEDDYLIAVNKPPDMPTHPSFGHQGDTLANVITYHYGDVMFRPVNRLDRDTSGIVLISKDQLTAHKISQQLKSGNVYKQYTAILNGKINPIKGRIETYIKRVSDSIIMREAAESGIDSEFAVTDYECIGCSNDYSIVNASPLTGRTHQLRVHFSYIGYPILGDTMYGTSSELINRQALHSHKTEFIHPYTMNPIKIIAPLPTDLEKIYYDIKKDLQ